MMTEEENRRDMRIARARYCYNDVAQWPEMWRKEARQRVQGLPVQVRTQGLMVTLAMLMAENKPDARRLTRLLSRWIMELAPYRPLSRPKSDREASAEELLAACANASRSSYAVVQQEALLVIEQIKIYANALVKEK